MKALVKDFKKFILRGNVLDLAVAVVVGTAFNAVVLSFANDVVMGIIGALFGKPNFSNLKLNLRGCEPPNQFGVKVCNGTVAYGAFITTIVNFLIVALGGVHHDQDVREAAEACARPRSPSPSR